MMSWWPFSWGFCRRRSSGSIDVEALDDAAEAMRCGLEEHIELEQAHQSFVFDAMRAIHDEYERLRISVAKLMATSPKAVFGDGAIRQAQLNVIKALLVASAERCCSVIDRMPNNDSRQTLKDYVHALWEQLATEASERPDELYEQGVIDDHEEAAAKKVDPPQVRLLARDGIACLQYDQVSRTATFTCKPDKNPSAPMTQIQVPRSLYPGGYKFTSLVGATVVSAPDSELLLLRANDDARKSGSYVMFTLRPRDFSG